MSPSLHGLRTVIYPAPDLDAAKAWWSEFLGGEPYFDQPFYVGFNVAGYELGLLPDGAPEDGALTYWGVDDVAGAVRAAIEAGSTEHTAPSDVGDGIVTAAVRTPSTRSWASSTTHTSTQTDQLPRRPSDAPTAVGESIDR